jgi:hypothetical protein
MAGLQHYALLHSGILRYLCLSQNFLPKSKHKLAVPSGTALFFRKF